ncbi:FAD-dependent oxidoreductase [Teichococcus oryzae]|uniref:NAD(P)/FAD-dependent oxidoreductase n=1 Tax=Teichococcus oryzae TaxID=1608942 RepID=A0A5B2TL10_9PROT|nr:FAD-dependent oxidoreductase [Pseudoroseomonas oryzae]KAA2215141.1 NAD(P)/FAD-dependent oxidoreductase [Pseudoroseomonas oryzae]
MATRYLRPAPGRIIAMQGDAGMPNHDVAVIGGGPCGISVAMRAASRGLKVVLFERSRLGGARHLAETVPLRVLGRLAAMAALGSRRDQGVRWEGVAVEWAGIRRALDDAQAAVAETYSLARLQKLGITVVRASAHFTAHDRIEAGGQFHDFRKAVVAIGTTPVIPDIPGLAGCSWLTPDRLLALAEQPRHLLILGGDAQAVELAQAFARLGSQVSIITDRPNILNSAEPEIRLQLRDRLRADGVVFHENTTVTDIIGGSVGVGLRTSDGARIEGTHLVLAAGTVPDLQPLDLRAAGVEAPEAECGPGDSWKSTPNSRIWMLGPRWRVGDSQAEPWLAGTGPMNIGRLAASWSPKATEQRGMRVRMVRSDPALLQFGQTEAEARAGGPPPRVIRLSYSEGHTGTDFNPLFLKVIQDSRGAVAGVSLLRQEAWRDQAILEHLLATGTATPTQVGAALEVPLLLDAEEA